MYYTTKSSARIRMLDVAAGVCECVCDRVDVRVSDMFVN